MTGIPVTWEELEAFERARVADTLEVIAGLPQVLEIELGVHALDAAATLASMTQGLVPIGVFQGPTALLDALAPLRPFLGPALAAADRTLRTHTQSGAVRFAGLVNLLRCSGDELPGVDEAAWLAGQRGFVGELDEDQRQALSLAALAWGRPDLVPDFAEPPPFASFVPGRTFGFDVQGFISYIRFALETSAPAEDIRPAWWELVERFPRLLGASMMTWAELVYAARAVLTRFEGRPVDQVVADLQVLVT